MVQYHIFVVQYHILWYNITFCSTFVVYLWYICDIFVVFFAMGGRGRIRGRGRGGRRRSGVGRGREGERERAREREMEWEYPPRSTVLFAILNRRSTGRITQYCL